MDFDPHIAEHLQGLRFSTWYISAAHIEVTAPTAYVLQGIHLRPLHRDDEPRGVVHLRAPGPYASLYVTALRAPTEAALADERHRLQTYLGNEWRGAVLDTQLLIASASLRGGIQVPATGSPETAADTGAGVVTLSQWGRKAG